jgi:hypothetical protein
MSTHSKAEFLKWVKIQHPALYQATMAQVGGDLGALSDTISKIFDNVTNVVTKVGGAYVQGRSAYELLKANIKRAKMGLPPAQTLDEANAPGAYTGGGGGFGGIPQWMIFAGVGLIAFMLLRR